MYFVLLLGNKIFELKGMLHKTQGIVICIINYSDKYMLVPIFTKNFGRVTYMISKSKSKTTKVPRSHFYPLAVLSLEVSHTINRDIQQIKESQLLFHQHAITSNLQKTSLVLFLSEFLNRIMKSLDSENNEQMFAFIKHAIQVLEVTENSIANFHLVFILKLTLFLGFYPNLEGYSEGAYFDMLNGRYVDTQPLHHHYLNSVDSLVLVRLNRISFKNMHRYIFNRKDRLLIIEKVLDYYRLHLSNFPRMKSLDVLHGLF